jgi:hypothetical protein
MMVKEQMKVWLEIYLEASKQALIMASVKIVGNM